MRRILLAAFVVSLVASPAAAQNRAVRAPRPPALRPVDGLAARAAALRREGLTPMEAGEDLIAAGHDVAAVGLAVHDAFWVGEAIARHEAIREYAAFMLMMGQTPREVVDAVIEHFDYTEDMALDLLVQVCLPSGGGIQGTPGWEPTGSDP